MAAWFKKTWQAVLRALTGPDAVPVTEVHQENNLETAESFDQESILQNYLDEMGELVHEKDLLAVKHVRDQVEDAENPDLDENALEQLLNDDQRAVRDTAQAKTVKALRRLDSERRAIVLRFLRARELSSFLLVSSSLNDVDLDHASFNMFNLRGANLCGSRLHGASLKGAALSEASLDRADLTEADLTGADLGLSNMANASLNGANLMDVDLTGANLTGASMTGANLREAILIGTILSDVDLTRTDLSRAHLYGANLKGSSLVGADLSQVDLRGADLRGANLSGANLPGADLSRAVVDSNQLAEAKNLRGAVMPDGQTYHPAIHRVEKGTTSNIDKER